MTQPAMKRFPKDHNPRRAWTAFVLMFLVAPLAIDALVLLVLWWKGWLY